MKKLLSWFDTHQRLTLAGILAGMSAISLGNMTRASIWFDEAFSLYLARFDFLEIAKFTAVDVHPPMYYWLLKVWTLCFGTSELAARSMSLLFAIIGLVGLFVLVRKYFTPRIALFVASIASLTPLLIRYTDEARMYTLIFAIVVWATYVLALQQHKPTKKRWIVYGLLVSVGMWTHYFTALAWLAHWVWRWIELHKDSRKRMWRRFFSKSWVWTHALAVGLFTPWIPALVHQFASVQQGFWIPPIGAYTLVDYISNGILYEQYGRLLSWWAVLFFACVGVVIWVIVKARKHVPSAHKKWYRLFAIMAVAPPLLLVLLSMPPLSSSFIDRYLLPAMVFLVAFVALNIAYVYKKHTKLALFATLLLLATMTAGVFNVYHYGNYNKNSNTFIPMRQLNEEIKDLGKFGQPIIAASPWIYYEMAAYDSREHRVYYIDKNVQYLYGSLEMLKQDDTGKIRDLKSFALRHKYIWYVAYSEDGEIKDEDVQDWKEIKRVSFQDPVAGKKQYHAVLYDTGSRLLIEE